jgi:hypothetical protein
MKERVSPVHPTDVVGRPLFIDGTYPKGRPVCASVFDLALATSDDGAFFEALGENGLFGGPWGSEVDAMSRDVRMLWIADWQRFKARRPLDLAHDEWFASYGAERRSARCAT